MKSELDKLADWLTENGYRFERIDDPEWNLYPRHAVVCKGENGTYLWDAICQKGSYGYTTGRLEIMGCIVTAEDGDSVVGYLTADDVIERVKRWNPCRNGESNE